MPKFLLLAALSLLLVAQPAAIAPYPTAPLCAEHDPTAWHGPWNSELGCHYDHEHGQDPTQFVSPFDIPAYLGGTWIGSAYPTSPAEMTVKHGGFKWFVVADNPNGCTAGFEGAANCVKSAAVQVHEFGDLSIELVRVHTVTVFEQICTPAGDCGWLFAVAHVDYGQRIAPYQGNVIPFADNPQPPYASQFGPYWSVDTRPGLTSAAWRLLGYPSNNVVSNKPTGPGARPAEPILVRILWRTRDAENVYDNGQLASLCDPAITCKYNNSTANLHELGGEVPAAWDGDEYDGDPRSGFVSRTGMLDGLPFQVLGAPVGKFGSQMVVGKPTNPNPQTNPDRDICWSPGGKGRPAAGTVVSCDLDYAVPSGWLSAN